MGGVGEVLTLLVWVACQPEWHAIIIVIVIIKILSWRKKTMLCYVETKSEKMFQIQIDLNSDLKEEPDLKS